MELERGDIQSKIVLILLDYRGRGAGKAKQWLSFSATLKFVVMYKKNPEFL